MMIRDPLLVNLQVDRDHPVVVDIKIDMGLLRATTRTMER